MIPNNCNFWGNLTRDPELKTTPGGSKVVNFSIAVNRYKKGEVDYIDCDAWDETAEYVANNCVKGDKIAVSAEYRFEKYTDKEGVEQGRPRFRVGKGQVQPIKLKKWAEDDARAAAESDEEAPAGSDAEQAAPRSRSRTRPSTAVASVPAGGGDDDEDIPF